MIYKIEIYIYIILYYKYTISTCFAFACSYFQNMSSHNCKKKEHVITQHKQAAQCAAFCSNQSSDCFFR